MRKKELIEAVQSKDIWSLDELWATFQALIANNRGYCMSVQELSLVRRIEYVDVQVHKYWLKCTDVYKCEDGFVGVRGIKHAFNFIGDAGPSVKGELTKTPCTASEYVEVPDYIYVPLEKSPYNNESC